MAGGRDRGRSRREPSYGYGSESYYDEYSRRRGSGKSGRSGRGAGGRGGGGRGGSDRSGDRGRGRGGNNNRGGDRGGDRSRDRGGSSRRGRGRSSSVDTYSGSAASASGSGFLNNVSGFLGSFFSSGDDAGGGADYGDYSSEASYEAGGIRFPSAKVLQEELLRDEEVKSKERWVREMILENVSDVFGGKTLRRSTCERRIARRVKELKAEPSNRDLYLDQPYLVRVAIDAAIPSVSDIVLDKVLAIADNRPPPRSDLRDNEMVTSKMDNLMDEVTRIVDRKLIPRCEQDIAKSLGGGQRDRHRSHPVSVRVDWGSFDAAPSWFVAADFLSKSEGAESFSLISDAFRAAAKRVAGAGVRDARCAVSAIEIRFRASARVIEQRWESASARGRGGGDGGGRRGGGGDTTLVIEGNFGGSGHDATLRASLASVEHAVIVGSLTGPGEVACAALASAADGSMPQSAHNGGNVDYVRWLVAHRCFWTPFHDPHASTMKEFASTLRSAPGSRPEAPIKAWSALLIDPKTDKEYERYVGVSSLALHVRDPNAASGAADDVRPLSALLGISWGPMEVASGGCCSGSAARARAAEGAHGTRLRFESGEIVLRGMPAPNPGEADAEKAHADEMALCVLAAAGGENNDAVRYERKPIAIERSAPAFSSSGSFNLGRKGVHTAGL